MTRDYIEDLFFLFSIAETDEVREGCIDRVEHEINKALTRNIQSSLCPIHDYDVKWCEECRRKDE